MNQKGEMEQPEVKRCPTAPANPAEGWLNQSDWISIADTFELSERESKVAQMLFEGCNRDAIANALKKDDGSSLSPETVRVYIDRLFKKLNVRSTAQMVQRILRTQFFEVQRRP